MKTGSAIIGLVISGAGAIAVTYAFVFTSLFQPVDAQVTEHSTEIKSLQDSRCILNSNMINLAVALKASYVSDPNCSSINNAN